MGSVQVSVLMSVFNGELYLADAINSILNQNFNDFEFIIIDDCSSDRSAEIIKNFGDTRIKYFRNTENLGLTKSLNIGLDYCKGNYIARMDSDDVSLPDRLEKQISFLENNPDVGLVGSCYKFIKGRKASAKVFLPVSSEEINCSMLFNNCIIHTSATFRKSIIEKFNLRYDECYKRSQDYSLWLNMMRFTRLANMNDVLVLSRVHENQISNKNLTEQLNDAIAINQLYISNLGIELNSREREIQNAICFGLLPIIKPTMKEYNDWLMKIFLFNKKKQIFNEGLLEKILARKLLFISGCSGFNLRFTNEILNSHFFIKKYYKMGDLFKLFVKLLINNSRSN